MKLASIIIALFISALPVLSGCSKATGKREQATRPLASVNGVPITIDDVLIQLGGHEDLLTSPVKDEVIDDIIKDELLYQKGVKLGLDKDEKFQSKIRLMEKRIAAYKRTEIARRVRDTQVAAKVNVAEEDLRDYYDKHAEEIGTDLHLGVLQFGDEVQAREAVTRIRQGVSFEKIGAEKFAHSPKGKIPGWDKGFLHWNEIPPDLNSVYQLKKGEVSDVLKSQMGIYAIKLIDRKKNQNAKYENFRAGITNRVNDIKIKETFDRYVEQLKSESSIKKDSQKKS